MLDPLRRLGCWLFGHRWRPRHCQGILHIYGQKIPGMFYFGQSICSRCQQIRREPKKKP